MLPIISVDAKEMCHSGFSLHSRKIEPIGDSYWFNWQKVIDAALKEKTNLDKFLTLRIGSFFARKRLRSNVLICYTPYQDRFVLSVCSKYNANLYKVLSSIPGYLEYGRDYLPPLAMPFIFFGGLQIYRLYCIQENPTTSYYIFDFGCLFGMSVEETQLEDYEQISKHPEQYIGYSILPVDPSENIKTNDVDFILQYTFCKWTRDYPSSNLSKQRKIQKILKRSEESLAIDAETWAKILFVASKWGWQPSRPTYFFLASDFEVNDEEARSLASTIERIWDAASKDPFNLDLSVNLSRLMDVGSFCLQGSFMISNCGDYDN